MINLDKHNLIAKFPNYYLIGEMMTTDYTIENAKLALPHLVHHAQMGKTLTYKQLGEKIDRHYRNAVPNLLGYIRDEICLKHDLPMLNAIVINNKTKLPGESFISGGTKHLSKKEYRERYEEIKDDVFAYDKWDDLI